MRTRWIVGVVCLVACGSVKPGSGPHASLRAQADEALKQASVLDYRAPASAVRIDRRTKADDLYLASGTKDGDVSSCAWAASLSHDAPHYTDADIARVKAATDVLVPRCLANDLDACRAFDGELGEDIRDYNSAMDALCEKGFNRACYGSSHWLGAEKRRSRRSKTRLRGYGAPAPPTTAMK